MAAAARHEVALLEQSVALGAGVEGLRRIGNPAQSVGIFSFVIDGMHPSDLGMLLDQQGIAVRTGHHCTQPLMAHYQLPGTVRASYSLYNTAEDVERLFAGIHKAKRLFG
jgi:cysteine desulfurase/selenocysteine lyase